MKITLSLYSDTMDVTKAYDHAPCPKCGAIDLQSAQRLCQDNARPCRLRGIPADVNGSFCAPVEVRQ